jgi:RNA polymerase sigma-70 factor (sigma-E family)
MKSEQESEFTEYVTGRSVALGRTAHLLCGDWHKAEDLVQSVLVRLYAVWPRLRDRDALDAYVRKMLVRAYLNDRRRPWRREHPTDTTPEVEASGGYGGVESRMVLLGALAALPPRQRAVVVLRYWEDYSLEDAATALGVSVGTVKSQAARGLAALRVHLGTEPSPAEGTSTAHGDAPRAGVKP